MCVIHHASASQRGETARSNPIQRMNAPPKVPPLSDEGLHRRHRRVQVVEGERRFEGGVAHGSGGVVEVRLQRAEEGEDGAPVLFR